MYTIQTFAIEKLLTHRSYASISRFFFVHERINGHCKSGMYAFNSPVQLHALETFPTPAAVNEKNAKVWHVSLWLIPAHHMWILLNWFSVWYGFSFPVLRFYCKTTERYSNIVFFFFFLEKAFKKSTNQPLYLFIYLFIFFFFPD